MSNDNEYTQRLAADFKSQRVINSYPSEVYGLRRSFVSPVLSDFSLDATTYRRCREEFLAREQVSAISDGIIVSVTGIIGAVAGGCYSFGAGLLGFFIGLFVGSALLSGKSGVKPSQDVLNADKYDRAVAEYKQAVEYKKQFEDEYERNERRKRERERQLQVRLERQKQENYWLNLNPYQFEEEVALCLKHGRVVDEAQVTKKSGDDGVDIWAQKGGKTIIIQCKAHAAPVGIKDIRELLGVKIHLNVPRAILVSRSTFTRSVHDFAHQNGLELIGIDDLLRFGHPQPLSGQTQQSDPFLQYISQHDEKLINRKPETKNESEPIDEDQESFLLRHGFDVTGWSHKYAESVIDVIKDRREKGLSTVSQARCLLKNGYSDAYTMSFEDASKAMDELSKKWERISSRPIGLRNQV